MIKYLIPFLVLFSGTSAAAFDDPAVAVCEYVWSHVSEAKYGNISRDDTKISANAVLIFYKYSILNTPPKALSVGCRFTHNIDGKIIVSVVAECSGSDATPKNSCRRIFDAQIKQETNDIFAPLFKSGIYPISPNDTKMSVSP